MTSRRRPKGTLVEPIQIGYKIESASKAVLEGVAVNIGISGADLLERMIERLGPVRHVDGAVAVRRPRGSRIDPKPLPFKIQKMAKAHLDAHALNAGLTGAAMLERMIAVLSEELTVRGVPDWWPFELASDNELELLISA